MPVPRILQFSQAILYRPERALYVRRISWSQEKTSYTGTIQYTQSTVAEAEFSGAAKWHQALAEGNFMLMPLFCYHSYIVSDLFIWTIHLFGTLGIQG